MRLGKKKIICGNLVSLIDRVGARSSKSRGRVCPYCLTYALRWITGPLARPEDLTGERLNNEGVQAVVLFPHPLEDVLDLVVIDDLHMAAG